MTNIIMEFQTTQITAFKTSMEVIDNLVPDVNLEVSADGIRFRETDPTGKLLLSVYFASDNFDVYNYYSILDKISVGIDISNTVSSLTQRLKYDVLKFKVYDNLTITIELESFSRSEKKKVKLLKVDPLSHNSPEIEPHQYSHSVNLSSELFSKYCKDIIKTSSKVKISLNKKEMVISCDKGNTEYTINGSTKHNLQITVEPDENKSKYCTALLSAKYFIILSKLSNISELVSIFIGGKPDLPPTIRYNLGSLGILNLILF